MPFWKEKTLEELTAEEWEALCDGCGKCCLIKLINNKTNKVEYTNVTCKYLDLDTIQCMHYEDRHKLVPDCVMLTPELIGQFDWLPDTCAYKLLAQGKDLQWWHPLISGDKRTVVMAGISIKGKVVSESEIDPDDIEDMVVDWFDRL